MDTNVQFSNIVTPPDFLTNTTHTVVIIDPTVSEIEDIALYLTTSPTAYTVYLYRDDMNNRAWLAKAMQISSAWIINSVQNEFSEIKDRIAVDQKAWHYGPKNFLMNSNHLLRPIDYFVQQDQPK